MQRVLWLTRRDSTTQIALIAVSDGVMRILKSLEWRYPIKMSLSPNVRYIAYDAPLRQDSADRDIFILAGDGRQEIPLVEHPAMDYGPVWTPGGGTRLELFRAQGDAGRVVQTGLAWTHDDRLISEFSRWTGSPSLRLP